MSGNDFSSILGNFGQHYTIKGWRGRDWRVTFISGSARSGFEKWCKQKKIAECRQMFLDGVMTEPEFHQSRDTIIQDSAAGRYHFWSTPCLSLMASEEGGKAFTLCLMRDAHPELNEADIAELWKERPGEVADVLALIQAEIQTRLTEVKKKAAMTTTGPDSSNSTPASSSPSNAVAEVSP